MKKHTREPTSTPNGPSQSPIFPEGLAPRDRGFTRRAESSMPASTSCVAAVLGGCCPMASQRGRPSTIILELGAPRRYLAEVARGPTHEVVGSSRLRSATQRRHQRLRSAKTTGAGRASLRPWRAGQGQKALPLGGYVRRAGVKGEGPTQ